MKDSCRVIAAELNDVCQSISEMASREYQGWFPSLFNKQLYLSSSCIQKATSHVVAHTTTTGRGRSRERKKNPRISLSGTGEWRERLVTRVGINLSRSGPLFLIEKMSRSNLDDLISSRSESEDRREKSLEKRDESADVEACRVRD